MGTCGVSTHLWVYGYVWGQYTPVGSVHTCGFMGSGLALQVHVTMDDPCSTRPWRKHSCRLRHSTHTLTDTRHSNKHTPGSLEHYVKRPKHQVERSLCERGRQRLSDMPSQVFVFGGP